MLLAMGCSEREARSSLRFSFGWENTEEEVREAAAIVIDRANKLKEDAAL